MKVLIKVSGDLLDREEVIRLIGEESQTNDVIVVVGGGTDITAALHELDPNYEPIFTPRGRRLDTPEQETVRLEELQANQKELLDKLTTAGIHNVRVAKPYIQLVDIPDLVSPENADDIAALFVHPPDVGRVIICTRPERLERKKQELGHLLRGWKDKVEIVAV